MISEKRIMWHYLWQMLYLVPIIVTVHYCKTALISNLSDFHYNDQANVKLIDNIDETPCKQLLYELAVLRRELFEIKEEMSRVVSWKLNHEENLKTKLQVAFDTFHSDQLGMFDFASEYSGGSIISTPETISYPSKFGLRLFGAIDWVLASEPNILLQPTTIPGKCYAFYGANGRIQIKLGRPVVITHVSLEHLRIGEHRNSGPKQFQVLAFNGDYDKENLGYFTYNLQDRIIQTFHVASKNLTFKSVELRILSNHGNEELTCVYRFRVHSLLN